MSERMTDKEFKRFDEIPRIEFSDESWGLWLKLKAEREQVRELNHNNGNLVALNQQQSEIINSQVMRAEAAEARYQLELGATVAATIVSGIATGHADNFPDLVDEILFTARENVDKLVAAEATIARVEVLADKWEDDEINASGYTSARTGKHCADELRAELNKPT